MHTSSTRHGVVEYFYGTFGFIVSRNSKDGSDGSVTKFLLHKSNILNDIPKVGSRVMFEVGEIPLGRSLPLALKVVTLRDKPPVAKAAETAVSGVE